VVGDLLAKPPHPDTEAEPAARDEIQRRDLLGGEYRIALRDKGYAGTENQRARRCSGCGERDEGIERAEILLRDRAAERVGARPGDRYVGVLGEKERFEAALLDGDSQVDRADALIRDERQHTETHGCPHFRRPRCRNSVNNTAAPMVATRSRMHTRSCTTGHRNHTSP
jgi:hypothetical protein